MIVLPSNRPHVASQWNRQVAGCLSLVVGLRFLVDGPAVLVAACRFIPPVTILAPSPADARRAGSSPACLWPETAPAPPRAAVARARDRRRRRAARTSAPRR